MYRFFVNKKEGCYFILDDKNLKHLKVVRVKNEQIVCIYKEQFYICKLENQKAKIIKKLNYKNEYKSDLILGVAIIEKKRFEWLIEKATELGVKIIIPIISTNVSQSTTNFKNKINRWEFILESAAKQSFRNCIPKILKPMLFQDVIKMRVQNKFIAHELANVLEKKSFPTNTLFLVGPEGGFTKEETVRATNNGFEIVNLGKRILRSETAAICLLSKVSE